MRTAVQTGRPVGQLLREWRGHRRLSQLELATRAAISTRHLSFVESGRSSPSRQMVLHLAEHLDLPVRERNRLLLAAGYAPVYAEVAPDDAPPMSAVRAAVRQVLAGHEPFPALAVDRNWGIVDANAGFRLFTGMATEPFQRPGNALRLMLHPGGMARRIVNLGDWRAVLLGRLQRRAALTADPVLLDLYHEVLSYPGGPVGQPEAEVGPPGRAGAVVPLRIRSGDRELAFFCTVAALGAGPETAATELAIESFFPADPDTAFALRGELPHRDALPLRSVPPITCKVPVPCR